MAHLSEEKMSTVVIDGVTWTVEEADHLAHCAECQEKVSGLTALATEMAVARRSAVSPEAAARYQAVFEQRRAAEASNWPQMENWLQALAVFDSREAGMPAGVRSAGVQAGYRLLFEAGETEIELQVEEEAGARRIEGEYFGVDDTTQGPVLIHLLALNDQGHVYETESNDGGRFRITQVLPGRYQMTLSTASDEVVSIDALEIT